MPNTASGVVQTRRLKPAELGDDDDAFLLYRPVPQVDEPVPMTTRFMQVTPEQAKKWLEAALAAEAAGTVRQRPLRVRDVRRWRMLMDSGRFVGYLPNGPLCFNHDGILLNGKHRLTSLVAQDKTFGFLVVENVPDWMFRYFDTGATRTLNDVFHISGRMTKAQAGSTTRLAMRYEEFIFGVRPEIGWKEWPQHRDEHADVDDFLGRREDLMDWYYDARQINKGADLVIASAMVFRFYQSLAWPDGEEKIIAFCNGLSKGAMLAVGNPALVLREWAQERRKNPFEQQIRARRELHLLLLFRMFALFVQGDSVGKMTWAYGFPMTMPYHPAGHEAAVKNVRAALKDLEREHKEAQAG